MTSAISGREKLLQFLTDWRARLKQIPVENLTHEQFGQLLTLNTVIYFVETHV